MPVDIQADRPINPDEGIPKPQIDVTARPVDTYVKPVSASASALGQLAGSLKSLNPALGQIEEKFKQQAEVQGETSALEAFSKEKGNWDQAVKNGDIPSVLNPFARMRARETFGRLAGDKLAGDIATDPQYIQENQNATTMQQHDAAWAGARERWEAKNLGHDSHSDPLFQNSFQTMASGHEKDARVKAAGEIEKNFVTLNGEQLHDELLAHINQAHTDGMDPAQLQDELSQMVAASGMPETVARASIATAIDDYARQNNDISAYDMASGIKIKSYNGKEFTMDTDHKLGVLRVAGRAEIVREKYQAVRLDNATQIHDENVVRNQVVTDLDAAVKAANGKPVDLQPFIDQYIKAHMGQKVNEIRTYYKALTSPPSNDTSAVAGYEAAIHDPHVKNGDINYITTATLTHALSDGRLQIGNYYKLQALIDKRDHKYASGRSQADPEARNTAFNRQMEQVKNLFSAQRMAGSLEIFKGDPQSMQNLALSEYVNSYNDYLAKNKGDVDPQDLDKFLTGVVAQLNAFYYGTNKQTGQASIKQEHVGKLAEIPIPNESE